MLSDKKLKAFLPTLDYGKAKQFFVDILGLTLLSEDKFALEVNANGTHLRITKVEKLIPHPFTVLGWDVDDIDACVRSLKPKGIVFERYEFLGQDDLNIWTAPGGSKVAWFKDPDGNLLSLSQIKAS
jgi:catechol 2,3-dioxygenase-like lactoylglutathione lyase family enzyme